MLLPEVLPTLLSPVNLRNILALKSKFDAKFRLLEANPGSNFKEAFKYGHIEKAIYVDTMVCGQHNNLYPRALPDKECFKDYIGSLGVSNKHHLILYDRSPFGFYASSRMWSIFRLFGHENVSILNGGLRSWLAQGYELSTQSDNYQKETFQVKENESLKRDYDQIVSNIETDKEQVVDVRGVGEFNSVNQLTGEPNHIPGSLNLPYSELFDPTTYTLKDKEQLLQVFKNSEVDLSKPIVASCMTGMTACSLALAAHIVGLNKVPVYYGSWTEYSQRNK